ncbi:PAS domain-containing sensor histidine kinase [Flagellimonas pacifica]|uniref:histidine kinase n=1 Tax=Flagellimonas pacifica TaxID=1247520 RepID=A0A285MVP1_9FLAO|nr:PAS domain-containing sensor histidine kinase [Allomuricauda parva]SNZ01260.1 PAS/PAC sensor signal transduction histidine kinase [Allomuricauda parva]
MKAAQKSGSRLSKMDNNQVSILKRALEREKKARKTAEGLLESKAKELYDASLHLKEANGRLEALLNNKGDRIDSAFINIIDPYVVMDMMTNVINMNASAKEFLGYDHTKEKVNLSNLVHPDYLEYTAESFKTLMQVGILNNYSAKIITKTHGERFVNINASLVYNESGSPIAAQGVIRDITQEAEIRKLLENQKKQQDIIVENSSLGILLIVKDKIIKANKSFVELLGYSELELKKLSINDISSLEDSNLYENLLQKSLENDSKKFSIVRKFHKKNGDTLYGKTSMSSLMDSSGDIEYSVAMIEDITHEKISEEKLRASEERMATLIKNLQTGILLEDQNRKIVLANQKFCDLFGIPVSPDVLKGVDSGKSIHKYKNMFLEPEMSMKRIDHVVKKKEVVTADEMELLDGRTFERDYIPLFNNDEYQGHLWSYNDVTLRKNYRKNLEIQKEKYSSIIANMNLGLVEVDSDENILMVNQSFSDMVGVPTKDLIGKHAKEAIHIIEEDREKLELHTQKRKEGVSDSYEVAVKIGNGEKRYWLISGAPRYDDAGKIIGSIGIHLDITEQKNLELQKEDLLKELEASNKGLQEYAHIVSHDLKSPLRSVSALATWLYDDYKDSLDENGRYNLKMMQEKIEGMDKLITGILKYSTVNSDTLDNTSVDINEVIREIEEIIYIPENVKIKTKKKLPSIKADKTKIHQLFQNFLSNAVVNIDKKDGLVEIDCKENKTHWEFSIKDNGVGIPKEYHEKIFQIFQSIGSNERSTGIGLSIVKKIIDRYHGKVWLESEIGEGTTFYFTLQKESKIKKT